MLWTTLVHEFHIFYIHNEHKGIVDPKIENLLLFTLEKNGLNKIDVFFYGIEESAIRFSLRCKENELHRKYKVLGGATENPMVPPILEIEQNIFENSYVHLYSKINFI